MNNTTAAQVLATYTIAAQEALGIDREAAFDLTVAAMIAEDPNTMRAFLSVARAQFERESANA